MGGGYWIQKNSEVIEGGLLPKSYEQAVSHYKAGEGNQAVNRKNNPKGTGLSEFLPDPVGNPVVEITGNDDTLLFSSKGAKKQKLCALCVFAVEKGKKTRGKAGKRRRKGLKKGTGVFISLMKTCVCLMMLFSPADKKHKNSEDAVNCAAFVKKMREE